MKITHVGEILAYYNVLKAKNGILEVLYPQGVF